MSTNGQQHPYREAVDDKPILDLTRAEARFVVAMRVGLNRSARTPFGKRDLFSIYWYLSGEEMFPKSLIGQPMSPEKGEMRKEVADVAGFYYSESGRGRGPNEAPFRKRQLQALARAVNETPDQRLVVDSC